jgi:phage pi2 protein 07
MFYPKKSFESWSIRKKEMVKDPTKRWKGGFNGGRKQAIGPNLQSC